VAGLVVVISFLIQIFVVRGRGGGGEGEGCVLLTNDDVTFDFVFHDVEQCLRYIALIYVLAMFDEMILEYQLMVDKSSWLAFWFLFDAKYEMMNLFLMRRWQFNMLALYYEYPLDSEVIVLDNYIFIFTLAYIDTTSIHT
jgi:hypothetical protein